MENSNYVLMTKKSRRFEIEVNALKEPFDQIFCKNPVQNKPYDAFELAAMTPQQKEKYYAEVEQTQPEIPEELKCEEKLKDLNKEYDQLKHRRFTVRRGRNNRIFYKAMEKSVFGFENDDKDNKENKLLKKRTHDEAE